MTQKKIRAVMIGPGRLPRPVEIENDLLALSRAVNIDRFGRPYPEFESFEIVEIKDNINIISSPKGEERTLPLVRTIGRYSKFYGVVYIVKMDGFDLVSMTSSEQTDYCTKFRSTIITLEELGLPAVDYGDDDDISYRGRVEITCDDW